MLNLKCVGSFYTKLLYIQNLLSSVDIDRGLDVPIDEMQKLDNNILVEGFNCYPPMVSKQSGNGLTFGTS
jgi:hypothetical protein